MKNRRNYYRILHVERDAPLAVIQASYRTLMLKLGVHPDLGGDPAEAAVVNEAFATLSDPARRAAYDRTLARAPGGRASTPASQARMPAPAAPPARPSTIACSFCSAACPAPIRPDSTCPGCGSPLAPATRHDAGHDPRRAMDRLPRDMQVTFRRAHAPRDALQGLTRDVSLDGLRLLSQVHLTVNERVRIESGLCSAVGVVRSVRRSTVPGLGGWECGIEFLTRRLLSDQGVLISTVA
jgi:DnaJ-class molecular chaperone